jgi:hypothetical protein
MTSDHMINRRGASITSSIFPLHLTPTTFRLSYDNPMLLSDYLPFLLLKYTPFSYFPNTSRLILSLVCHGLLLPPAFPNILFYWSLLSFPSLSLSLPAVSP